VLFIRAIVAIGLAWNLICGRHQVGMLPEHAARKLEEAV
jgi:hypothetical protein